MRYERIGLAEILDLPLADQVHERFAEAQRSRRGALAGWCLDRVHRRARYPRGRVRVAEHTIEIDNSPVFYRSAQAPGAGAGPRAGTTTLYLHGLPTSSEDWVPFLARGGGVAPDLIGFGRSGKAANLDYSIDGHADFVARLLDRLGIDRIELVAHGWGAAGGLAFAQRHPERIAALVLIDALPLLEGFHWPLLARIWRRRVLGELAVGSINRWALARMLDRGCARRGAWPPERVAGVWEQLDQGTQRAILRLHRSADEPALARAGAELETLRAPALVIWGECDPWLPATFAEAYASRLPRAALELVPGAGHWPWLEQPEVVEQVVSFLERG